MKNKRKTMKTRNMKKKIQNSFPQKERIKKINQRKVEEALQQKCQNKNIKKDENNPTFNNMIHPFNLQKEEKVQRLLKMTSIVKLKMHPYMKDQKNMKIQLYQGQQIEKILNYLKQKERILYFLERKAMSIH